MGVQELWDENYRLTKALHGKVLDAGCGKGDYTQRLRDLPYVTEVVPMDILPPTAGEMMDQLIDHLPIDNYVTGDIQDMPFVDNEFDGIFCWRVLQYCPDTPRVLREFARVLKPGGLLVVRMPIDPKGVPPPHARPYHEELAKGRADAFTWRTYWDEARLEREAGLVGFASTGHQVDRSGSQVWLLRLS